MQSITDGLSQGDFYLEKVLITGLQQRKHSAATWLITAIIRQLDFCEFSHAEAKCREIHWRFSSHCDKLSVAAHVIIIMSLPNWVSNSVQPTSRPNKIYLGLQWQIWDHIIIQPVHKIKQLTWCWSPQAGRDRRRAPRGCTAQTQPSRWRVLLPVQTWRGLKWETERGLKPLYLSSGFCSVNYFFL